MNIKTVYEGIRRGDIPAFRVGKIYRIPRPTFDQMLRDGKAGGGAAA